MKFKRTVIKIGDSLGITIPTDVVSSLKLNEGFDVMIKITRHLEDNCLVRCSCGAIFTVNTIDDVVDCADCGKESLFSEIKILEQEFVE